MRYRSFSFKNFKGINDMTLELTGDVTTLIGLNESGKTTILEGIFCFTYGAENLDALDPNMASLREPERWIPISRRANFNDTISITATLELSAEDKKLLRKHMLKEFELRVADIQDELGITESYEFTNSRFDKSSKTWTLNLQGTMGRQRKTRSFSARTPEWQGAVTFMKTLLPSIWYFPNFLFELPERFNLEAAQEEAPSEDRDKSLFYRSTFDQLISQLGYGANLDTHVVERLKSPDEADHRNLQSLLLDMGREMTETIFEGWNRIFGRAPSAQEVELKADKSPAGATYLELKIKAPDGYYDLSERSLGFRWFFMFLLMTTYRGVAQGDRPALFLLDEPASNLHSSAQAELLKSFETLAKTCHLIYTTHSHHLINIRWLDSAYVVKNEALDGTLDDYFGARIAGHTSISATRYRRFVAENPEKTSYFQPVLDLLDYRPSFLEQIPSVILVEGKTDFYLLKYFIDVIGMASELHFVPGEGSGSLDPLIRLHIGWGKNFLVLLDGDREGRKQKARLESEFGSLIGERCVLLPDVSGDDAIVEVEHLLSEPERTRMLETHGAGTRHSKRAIQLAIMELFAQGKAIELEDGTRQRIATLLGELARKLAGERVPE